MDYIRQRLIEYQNESGNHYNLEATPAEGTSYRLALLDVKKFPDIIVANPDSKSPFYTNSTQLPVNFTEDVFEALDHQNDLQSKYTGGTVFHIFGGERMDKGESVKKLVKKVCDNYNLPYFTFSPTFSICPEHGYISGEKYKCPQCNQSCEVYSRIVGYLRPISQWNDGKKAEFKMRKNFYAKDRIDDSQLMLKL
jgi:ribonucleoside-triphosphate reductase